MSQEILNDTAEIVIDSDAIKESISGNQDDWSDDWTQCGILTLKVDGELDTGRCFGQHNREYSSCPLL